MAKRRSVKAALDAFDLAVPEVRNRESARAMLSETETKALENDLAKAARAYGRAVGNLARARSRVRKAEAIVKDVRRTMRLLISSKGGK